MNIKKIIRIFLKTVLALVLVFMVFSSGAYLAIQSDLIADLAKKEALYLGKLTGKYTERDGVWSQNINFNLYWDVWDMIKENYANGDLDEKKIFYGSIKGMVSALDDPHSQFLDPIQNKEFKDDMSGSFEGIGAEIGIRDNILTIISPLEGTPAFQAGIMAGDKIIEIDGEITRDMGIDEAVSKIRGPKGSEVTLTIFRNGVEELLEIKIIRDTIVIKSIKYEILDNNISYIKISSFNNDTEYLFSRAVQEALNNNSKDLIIDLRNNPGGYLETSVSILGEWINGEVAVIERFGDGRLVNYRSRGLNRLKDMNTVVLINAGSASASEILAGALRDYELATIIGEKSYGKGSVQMIKGLRDGSALKVTIAKWLSPKGNNIDEEGIVPDQEVALSFEDYKNNLDPQLEAAIAFFIK